MKVYDQTNKVELDLTRQQLLNLLTDGNREVDFIMKKPQSDESGLVYYDKEIWVCTKDKSFTRSYEYKGRALRGFHCFHFHDLDGQFDPRRSNVGEVILV